MGTPYVAPKPPFSTYTAMAILGLSIGAKPMNAEWSLPLFCAVPVLPHTSSPGMLAARQVPSVTARRMPSTTSSYALRPTLVLFGVRNSCLIVSPSIALTICGVIYVPLFAMVAPRFAICNGVSVTSPCPMAMLITVTARQ